MNDNLITKIKYLFKGLGILILYFLLPYILIVPFVVTKLYKEDSAPWLNSIIYLIVQIITLFIFVIIYWSDLKQELTVFKENYRPYLNLSFKIWFIGLILMMASNLIINVIFFKGSGAANELANRDYMRNYPLFAFPAIIIIAPIVEELVFRKSFKKVFSKMLPFVIFTGLLFGSIHVVTSLTSAKDLLYLIPYGALGIALSYMYYKTNNIIANISIHAFHNLFTVIVVLMSWLLRYLG